MRRVGLLVIFTTTFAALAAWAAVSVAQAPAGGAPYQPAVPQASMVAGYGGFPAYGGGTVSGSAAHGMASVISASGDAALSASAAAVNLTQAEANDIENRKAATNAYFEMRATNKAAVAAERGPPPTAEQLARIAHQGVPKPLTAKDHDPVTGALNWPGPLQEDTFAAGRGEVEQLVMKQANYGKLTYAEQTKMRTTINGMFKDLKAMLKDLPSADYLEARSFLNSILYATTKKTVG